MSTSHPDWDLRVVTATATADLRQAVLRPGGMLLPPGEDDPQVHHLGAYDAAGRLVGCGNVRPDRAPFASKGQHWRVRGMATAPDLRSRGAGTAVLAGLLEHARAAGGGLLWCNARIAAQRLYERAGLQTWGKAWVDPDLGPHVVMWRRLEVAELEVAGR